MLSVIVTLSKGRERENEGSHAHWHVNIQADGICSRGSVASLTNLEHTSDTKLIFPFWAQSSGWICKRAWLVGEAFCEHPKGHRGSLLNWGGHYQARHSETTWKSLWWLPPGAPYVLRPLSSLCTELWGYSHETVGTSWIWGAGSPQNGCCFPSPSSPLLSHQSPSHSLLTETVITIQRKWETQVQVRFTML